MNTPDLLEKTPLTKLLVESEEKINVFLKKWTGSNYPHLVDTDDNDGEFLRCDVDELIRKAYLLGLERAKECLPEKKEEFLDGTRDQFVRRGMSVGHNDCCEEMTKALDSAIGEVTE